MLFRLSVGLALVVSTALGCYLASLAPTANAVPSPEEKTFKTGRLDADTIGVRKITAEKIVLTDELGEEHITMVGGKYHRGIWIEGNKPGHYIAVYSVPGQNCVIGVGDPRKSGYPFAVSVDQHTNKAVFQVVGADGKTLSLDAEEVIKVAKQPK